MPKRQSKTGSELFIVDNSDQEWKVLRYLHDWCQLSKRIDIATGYFDIGSLLALKDEWQKVDGIRILMGDEVSRRRTKRAFEEGLQVVTGRLDDSLEFEKEKNDFLVGVPAIVEGIRSGKILCRVYRKDKFHAKAYITHARMEVIGSSALVGSSNFTYPGLTENIELNVQITGGPVTVLQEWYDEHWNAAEDVTPEILRVIERHIQDYTPFDVYAKALQEFFRGHEMTADEWELTGAEDGGSHMYPVLDQYQKEGYHNLLKIAKLRGGAFLCDGVGLGKTYIGLMLIERLIRDRQRVMLIVPKAAREAVWEPALNQYLRHLHGDFSNLAVFSHTDLQRGGEYPPRFIRMKEMADAVVIDEAHHFRNPGAKGETAVDLSALAGPGRIKGKGRVKPSRYRLLYDLIEGTNGPKRMYMLTATPINNKLADFRHMTELFSRDQDNYFESIGVHSLRGHFLKMERALKKLTEAPGGDDLNVDTDLAEAEALLRGDDLFHSLVVQRSRAYVTQSQQQQGVAVTSFPERGPPKVAGYSVKKTYGRLLDLLEKAFHRDKPLFSLAIYYPLGYYKGPDETIDPFEENRQKQVIGLIRVQFLKRFESSARAFERSCERLLIKLLAFVTRHAESDAEKRLLDRWKRQNADLIGYVSAHQLELWGDDESDETMEDLVTEEMLEDVEHLDPAEYRVDEMLDETYLDLDQVVRFLEELGKFKPRHDDKLKALLKLLKSDPVMKEQKVLLFTEFADTAK
ncbi:MAG: phospholipase D-like domain-containing protein, partial [Planctomycetota bacterium]